MSQNKTVIQGLEPADAPKRGFNPNVGASTKFYSRRGNASGRGTVVAGMEETQTYQQQPIPSDEPVARPRHSVSGKPVVGFLYSVSRTSVGEFWPLHIGQNTIGQSPDCDIVLSEGTVSGDHAVLVVRKMKNPEKVIASISDARSTNGTMLNGVSLGFTAEECKNGDKIVIGDNYELYLILVDPVSLGLSVSKDFIPIEVEEEEEDDFEDMVVPDFPGGYTRPGADYRTFGGGGTSSYSGGHGTVGMDGSSPFNDKGGTVGM